MERSLKLSIGIGQQRIFRAIWTDLDHITVGNLIN